MRFSLSLFLVCTCVTHRESLVEYRQKRIEYSQRTRTRQSEARKFVGDFRVSIFALLSSRPPFFLFIPAHATDAHGARYWINNALITFHGTTTVVAGSEFPNYTPWQITRIKFNRMREFAYRNDGIPRDVIQPRLFRPSECSLCASSYKRSETEREREDGRKEGEG